MFEKNAEELTSEISKWAGKEVALLEKRRETEAAIATAEEAAGAAWLDSEGESPRAPVEAVLRLRAEVAAIEGAIVACRARRLTAIRTKRTAEAAALRKQAGELRAEVATILGKVRKHLAVIAELQEMGEVTAVPTSNSTGGPKTQGLLEQADGLEARAAGLEAELPRRGAVDVSDATTTEPLIEAVLRFDGEVPNVRAIRDWAERCEAGRQFGDYPRRFHLEWRDGRIDAGESYIQVAALLRTHQGPTYGGLVGELGTDIFKAGEPSRGSGV